MTFLNSHLLLEATITRRIIQNTKAWGYMEQNVRVVASRFADDCKGGYAFMYAHLTDDHKQ